MCFFFPLCIFVPRLGDERSTAFPVFVQGEGSDGAPSVLAPLFCLPIMIRYDTIRCDTIPICLDTKTQDTYQYIHKCEARYI